MTSLRQRMLEDMQVRRLSLSPNAPTSRPSRGSPATSTGHPSASVPSRSAPTRSTWPPNAAWQRARCSSPWRRSASSIGSRFRSGAAEFIRRMLLHVLPPGFHRIRYYGFLANRARQRKLAECRRALCTPPPPAAQQDVPVADYRDRYEALTGRSLRQCPRCHAGNMQPIDHPVGAWACPAILDSS